MDKRARQTLLFLLPRIALPLYATAVIGTNKSFICAMAEPETSGVEGASAMAPGLASSEGEEERSTEDNVTLSFLDKLKCMMYSKQERDAFLIEKLEKEEKKKAKCKDQKENEEIKCKKKKTNLLDKLKSVFSTPEEQHEFLQRQVDDVEKKSDLQSPNEMAPVPKDPASSPQ